MLDWNILNSYRIWRSRGQLSEVVVRSLGSGVNYTDCHIKIMIQHVRLYHITPLRITWMVWKDLGVDHRWQHYRQVLFSKSVHLSQASMWNCKSSYQVICFIQLSETGVLSIYLKIDKIEYRAVIKFCVKEGLMPSEIYSKFINVYKTLLLRFQQLRNGLPSSNVAVPALKLIHVE
jgi:hypothetical protein